MTFNNLDNAAVHLLERRAREWIDCNPVQSEITVAIVDVVTDI